MCHYVGQVYADVDARGTNAFIADPLAPPSTPDRGDVRGWSSVVDSGAVPEAQSRGLEPPPPHLSSFQNGENHYSSGGRARKNLRRGFPAHQSARTTAGAGTEADRPVGHEMACVPFWACAGVSTFCFTFLLRLELLSRHSLFLISARYLFLVVRDEGEEGPRLDPFISFIFTENVFVSFYI